MFNTSFTSNPFQNHWGDENWEKVAKGFEKNLQIPSCIGALATKRIYLPMLANNYGMIVKFAIVVLFVDSKMRIINYEISQLLQNPTTMISDAVEHVFEVTGIKKYIPAVRAPLNTYTFIGNEQMEARPHLIVPSQDTPSVRYTNEQIQRALGPAKAVEDILTARFGLLEKNLPELGQTDIQNVVHLCCTLHNYMLETNPAYSADFVKAADQ